MKYNATYDEHGKLHIIHEKEMKADLRADFLPKPGKKTNLTVEIKKRKSIRTLSQNAYYWGVIITMVRDRLKELSGEKYYSKEQAHEFILLECWFKEVVNEDSGLVFKIRKETHDLSKGEYAEFIDTIIDWCSMWLDIEIPPPDTQAEMTFENE